MLFTAGIAIVIGILVVRSRRKRRHTRLSALADITGMGLRDRAERADFDSLLMLEQPGQHIEYALQQDEHRQFGLWPQVIGGNRGGSMKIDRGFVRVPNTTGLTPGILVASQVKRGLFGIPGSHLGQLEKVATQSWTLRTVAGETDLESWRAALAKVAGTAFEKHLSSFEIEVTPDHVYLFGNGAWKLGDLEQLHRANTWAQQSLAQALVGDNELAQHTPAFDALVAPRPSQGKSALAWTVGIIGGILLAAAASILVNDAFFA